MSTRPPPSNRRRIILSLVCVISAALLLFWFLDLGDKDHGGIIRPSITLPQGGEIPEKSVNHPVPPEESKKQQEYTSAKNGLELGGVRISFPHEMTWGTGVSGNAATLATQHVTDLLAREGTVVRGTIRHVAVFPNYLNSPDDGWIPMGRVFLIKGSPESAAQKEKELHDDLEALTKAEDFETFWERFKAAAGHDPNLRGFGKYDLYVQFREEDPNNKIVVFKYALCEAGTLNVVSSRHVQSSGFGPYLGAIFSTTEPVDE